MHKPLTEEEIEAVDGYLESVQNEAMIARLLIKDKRFDALFTILEEIGVNAQNILDYCVVEDS